MSTNSPERFDDLPILAELRDLLTAHYRSAAAAANPHRSRLVRAHHGRPLVLFALLVLAGTTAALAATGVFRAGSPVASPVPATPHAHASVAIAGSVKVLALRFADPSGGPPWGLRIDRTTRGLVCVQPGRVEFGQVGALGIDGALRNDERFHPFSTNYLEQFGCGRADGRGHAFAVATLHEVPASAIENSCMRSLIAGGGPVCPPGVLRDISYGMLGPDAVSITYADPTGRLITVPTAGPDGAFLVVSPALPQCPASVGSVPCDSGASDTNGLNTGVIRTVTYRSGRTCILRKPTAYAGPRTSCPPVGYVAPAAQPVTATQIAAPVTVRNSGLQYFCRATRGLKPCGTNPPPSAHRVALPPEYVVVVSFIARVAIHDVDSHYTITTYNPPLQTPTCREGTAGTRNTDLDVHAGQRVQTAEFIPKGCTGTFHVLVTYSAPGSPAIRVGQAAITLARRNNP